MPSQVSAMLWAAEVDDVLARLVVDVHEPVVRLGRDDGRVAARLRLSRPRHCCSAGGAPDALHQVGDLIGRVALDDHDLDGAAVGGLVVVVVEVVSHVRQEALAHRVAVGPVDDHHRVLGIDRSADGDGCDERDDEDPADQSQALHARLPGSSGSRPWTLTLSSRVRPVSSIDVPAGGVDALLTEPAGGIEGGEQVVVGLHELVHGDDGLVVEVADLVGLAADGTGVLDDHLAEELTSPLGRLPHPRLPHEGGLDRQADGHHVGGQRQRAVDRLPEAVVVLAGELDAQEVLDVDLLHRAQVLQPRRDVVHGGLDAVALEGVIGLGQQQGQVVEQQLAEEGLPLDGFLLGLDVLVQPPELHVVAGQGACDPRAASPR